MRVRSERVRHAIVHAMRREPVYAFNVDLHPLDDTLANIVPCQLVAAPGGLVVHGSDEPPTVSTVQRKHSEEVKKRTLGALETILRTWSGTFGIS